MLAWGFSDEALRGLRKGSMDFAGGLSAPVSEAATVWLRTWMILLKDRATGYEAI